MNKLYVPIGYVGSGKSTWAKKMAAENPMIKIVSPDIIRKMLDGEYNYHAELDPLIEYICVRAIKILLTNGYEVIIDCCNLGQKRRKRWIKAAESTKKEIVKVAVIFPNKSKVWHVNNRMKEPHNIDNLRSYWEKVYDLHKSQFEPIDVTMFDDVVHVESL